MVFRASVTSLDGLRSAAIEGPADNAYDAVELLAPLAFERFERDHPDAAGAYDDLGNSLSILIERLV